MKKVLFLIMLTIMAGILLVSCTQTQKPPVIENKFTPENGTKHLEGTVRLTWKKSESNVPLTYAVYVGESETTLNKVAEKLTNNYYDIQTEPNKRYYWKIEVSDGSI